MRGLKKSKSYLTLDQGTTGPSELVQLEPSNFVCRLWAESADSESSASASSLKVLAFDHEPPEIW